tara:strand:+ start:1041 stop:1397 length:357 start_codon:yes stop_codon:yes gene_type:complete
MAGKFLHRTAEGLSYEVKFAQIDEASTGDQEVVAAVTGQKIRVVAMSFTCVGAVGVSWKSAANEKIGHMKFAANGGPVWICPEGAGFVVETNEGEALNINLDATVQVDGWLNYVELSD